MKTQAQPPSVRLGWALEFAAHHVLRLLPVGVVSALGALMGRAAALTKPAAAQRVRDNLRRLRPDVTDPREIDAMARRFWENAGRCLAEFAALGRIWGSNRVTIEGLDDLLAARATGKARICIFVHLGNWEVLGPTLVDLGETDGMQIFQPPLNPVRRRLAENVRRPYEKWLVAAEPRTASRIFRNLKAGGGLSIAVDEYVNGVVKAPAFGRPLSLEDNLARAARLAMRTDALVFVAYVARGRSAHFTVRILPPVAIDFGAMTEEQLPELVGRLNAIIEPIVLEHIDQWFWLDNLKL